MEKAMATHSSTLAWKILWAEEPGRLQSMGLRRVGHNWATSISLFTFHFHALEKEMATHSIVLAWRIPGTGEPGGLPSMGSHRIGHDWSNLAACILKSIWWGSIFFYCFCFYLIIWRSLSIYCPVTASFPSLHLALDFSGPRPRPVMASKEMIQGPPLICKLNSPTMFAPLLIAAPSCCRIGLYLESPWEDVQEQGCSYCIGPLLEQLWVEFSFSFIHHSFKQTSLSTREALF